MLTVRIIAALLAMLAEHSGFAADEAPAAAAERRSTAVNRIELVIDRPAAAIWPYLLDFTRWAADQKVEYLNDRWGEPGGKLRRRTVRDGRLTQDRIEEIVAIERAWRLTVRARPAPPDPSNTDVIANMELIPLADGKTRFRLDVYLAADLPQPLDLESTQRRKQQMESTLTSALLARYEQLKTAVEKK